MLIIYIYPYIHVHKSTSWGYLNWVHSLPFSKGKISPSLNCLQSKKIYSLLSVISTAISLVRLREVNRLAHLQPCVLATDFLRGWGRLHSNTDALSIPSYSNNVTSVLQEAKSSVTYVLTTITQILSSQFCSLASKSPEIHSAVMASQRRVYYDTPVTRFSVCNCL